MSATVAPRREETNTTLYAPSLRPQPRFLHANTIQREKIAPALRPKSVNVTKLSAKPAIASELERTADTRVIDSSFSKVKGPNDFWAFRGDKLSSTQVMNDNWKFFQPMSRIATLIRPFANSCINISEGTNSERRRRRWGSRERWKAQRDSCVTLRERERERERENGKALSSCWILTAESDGLVTPPTLFPFQKKSFSLSLSLSLSVEECDILNTLLFVYRSGQKSGP